MNVETASLNELKEFLMVREHSTLGSKNVLAERVKGVIRATELLNTISSMAPYVNRVHRLPALPQVPQVLAQPVAREVAPRRVPVSRKRKGTCVDHVRT